MAACHEQQSVAVGTQQDSKSSTVCGNDGEQKVHGPEAVVQGTVHDATPTFSDAEATSSLQVFPTSQPLENDKDSHEREDNKEGYHPI